MKIAFQAAVLPFACLMIGLAFLTANDHVPADAQPGAKAEAPVAVFDRGPKNPSPPEESAPVSREPASVPEEFREFKELKRKALPTTDDLKALARLRSNRAALQTAVNRLSNFESEIQAREEYVALLQDAMLDRQNPERDFVVAKVEELILADNLRVENNRAHRAALAADKGELVLAYLDANPGRLQFLLNASAGSPNIRVVENAIAVGERRRAQSLKIIEELESSVSN